MRLKYLFLFIPLIAFGQPEAKWLFENNGIDSSGNGHTITLSGGASYNTTIKKQGTYSSYYYYGDKAQTNAKFNLADTFSISLWFNKPSTAGDYEVLIGNKDNGGSSGFAIYFDNILRNITLRTTASLTANRTTSNSMYNYDTWTHLAVVIDTINSLADLYINGTKQLSGVTLVEGFETNDSISIGSYRSIASGWPFYGYVDNVQIYSCMLSESKIDSLVSQGATSYNVECSDISEIIPDSVVLGKQTHSLAKGNTYNLASTIYPVNSTNTSISWSTSDATVVGISPGLVSGCFLTGLKAGTSNIIATTQSGTRRDTCVVTVTESNVIIRDTIKINFCNNSTAQTTGNWNNLNNTTTGTVNSLIRSNGISSSVTLQNVGTIWNDVQGDVISGIYPVNCMNGVWGITSDTGMLIISNLIQGKEYKFKVFGSRATYEDRYTGYSVHGLSDTLLVTNNDSDYVEFTFESYGTDTLLFYDAGQTYGYINVLEIIPQNNYSKRFKTVKPGRYVYNFGTGGYVVNATDYYNDYIDNVIEEEIIYPDIDIMFYDDFESYTSQSINTLDSMIRTFQVEVAQADWNNLEIVDVGGAYNKVFQTTVDAGEWVAFQGHFCLGDTSRQTIIEWDEYIDPNYVPVGLTGVGAAVKQGAGLYASNIFMTLSEMANNGMTFDTTSIYDRTWWQQTIGGSAGKMPYGYAQPNGFDAADGQPSWTIHGGTLYDRGVWHHFTIIADAGDPGLHNGWAAYYDNGVCYGRYINMKGRSAAQGRRAGNAEMFILSHFYGGPQDDYYRNTVTSFHRRDNVIVYKASQSSTRHYTSCPDFGDIYVPIELPSEIVHPTPLLYNETFNANSDTIYDVGVPYIFNPPQSTDTITKVINVTGAINYQFLVAEWGFFQEYESQAGFVKVYEGVNGSKVLKKTFGKSSGQAELGYEPPVVGVIYTATCPCTIEMKAGSVFGYLLGRTIKYDKQ